MSFHYIPFSLINYSFFFISFNVAIYADPALSGQQ